MWVVRWGGKLARLLLSLNKIDCTRCKKIEVNFIFLARLLLSLPRNNNMNMKKLIITTFFAMLLLPLFAQEVKDKKNVRVVKVVEVKPEKLQAEIKFEKVNHNFGTFAADTAVLDCEFKFTNVGNADLYIHQAFASCGCTVPDFPIEAIKPGESGVIKVTYDGTHKAPGSLRRSISVHTNAKTEMVKLYITGKMLPRKINEVPTIKVDED